MRTCPPLPLPRHIEILLFSTSFVISVLFGDVKADKIGSFCVTGRSNIAIFFEHKNLPLFCQKEEGLPLLFHKMLEGLYLCTIQMLRTVFCCCKFDPHPPPRNANSVRLCTFVMLIRMLPPPIALNVTIEWPHKFSSTYK